MLKYVIKRAEEWDAAVLLKAFREIAQTSDWLLTEADELPKTIAKERAFIRQHRRSKNSTLAVAWVKGEVAGLVGAGGGSHRRNRHTAEVGLAIRKAYRGLGLGTVLMRYLIRWAKGAGITRLHLSHVRENKIAGHLYRRMGFRREGVLRKGMKIGGRYHDMIVLAKIL